MALHCEVVALCSRNTGLLGRLLGTTATVQFRHCSASKYKNPKP